MTKEPSVRDVVLTLHDNMLNLMENEAIDVKEYHEYTDKHIDQALAQIKELMPSVEELAVGIENIVIRDINSNLITEMNSLEVARFTHKLIEGRLK